MEGLAVLLLDARGAGIENFEIAPRRDAQPEIIAQCRDTLGPAGDNRVTAFEFELIVPPPLLPAGSSRKSLTPAVSCSELDALSLALPFGQLCRDGCDGEVLETDAGTVEQRDLVI